MAYTDSMCPVFLLTVFIFFWEEGSSGYIPIKKTFFPNLEHRSLDRSDVPSVRLFFLFLFRSWCTPLLLTTLPRERKCGLLEVGFEPTKLTHWILSPTPLTTRVSQPFLTQDEPHLLDLKFCWEIPSQVHMGQTNLQNFSKNFWSCKEVTEASMWIAPVEVRWPSG